MFITTMGQHAKNEILECSSLNGIPISPTFLTRLRYHCLRVKKMLLRHRMSDIFSETGFVRHGYEVVHMN